MIVASYILELVTIYMLRKTIGIVYGIWYMDSGKQPSDNYSFIRTKFYFFGVWRMGGGLLHAAYIWQNTETPLL